ncbi:hypothetical protein C4D60_Mb06t03740 [Musa balbisiana]|uniref:Dynein light chain n=1 Tax=Musa balbisiana TaxID=52838 RepID=A0A4S8IKC3_MUSBA|nr:hypothetical protein C4D60_Mb06t03740 [Musa balbisiana]
MRNLSIEKLVKLPSKAAVIEGLWLHNPLAFVAVDDKFLEFDSLYGPAWHCIVGRSFGSYVTHTLGGFLYFSIDKVYILLFRTAVKTLGH